LRKRRKGDGFATAILRPINTAAISILAAYTFLWGLWVVNPFWNVFERAELYHKMGQLFPEVVWGLFALSIGLFMAYGVIRQSYGSLTRGALAGFFHWFIIGIFYFYSDWQSTGGITAMMLAVYCAFIYVNLRVNRYTTEFRHHNLLSKNE
jgi:hypothetical protein